MLVQPLNKISLKKEGGSQLMSGSKGESIATVKETMMGEVIKTLQKV